MKIQNAMSVSCIVVAMSMMDVRAQGNFTNLNFESAYGLPNPQPTQPTLVPTANALPGWTVVEGGYNPTQIYFNGVSAGSSLVTIIGTQPAAGVTPALSGIYSVTLDAGEGSTGFLPAGISQSGTIPSSAQSLRFIASGDISDADGNLTVSFIGQNIPFTTLATGQNYNTYGANISPFAGQTGQLGFSENPGQYIFGITYLDNISFSNQPIPEPSTWTLILFGAGLIGVARWTRFRIEA